MDNVKKILENPRSSASGCFLAVTRLLEDTWLAWEPESIWLELKRKGISIPEVNRSALLAVRALQTTGLFWTDALVFEKTCMAFNHELPSIDTLDDCPVEYICWTMQEVEHLSKIIEAFVPEDLEREPVRYVSVQLFIGGFVVAPELVRFAQAYLDTRLPAEVKTLQKRVLEGWAAAPKDALLDAAYPETPAGVQLAKLAAVHHYVQQCEAQYLKDIATLREKA